jgi:hypothetical protein
MIGYRDVDQDLVKCGGAVRQEPRISFLIFLECMEDDMSRVSAPRAFH